ncbi:MAG TPA: helix-turn-helix domain-containing protein [Candidatus Nanoarchaeia archaeon]|nr:helix-turn-helix domain-containing protein [Candidatus Nanoarchaeia archaeon]
MEQELRSLGLSEYESKVYITLVRDGTLTGLKTSMASNVPQGKIYETIYKLSDKGFVSIMNAKPKLFKAIDPEIALKQYIKLKKENLIELEKNLPKRIKQLSSLRTKETDEKVSIFRGKKNAFTANHYLMDSASKSIDMMFTFEIIQTLTKRILLDKISKGLKIRILATKKENRALIREILGYGLEVRFYPVQELRIFIKDGKESNIQILNKKNFLDRTNILIQSEELSKALKHYFDKVWKKAEIIK